MQKRGQVTLFIVIAIVIVAVALISIFLWPSIRDRFMSEERASQILASQAEPLRDAVHDCVEKVSLEIFEKIGMQGGYYDWKTLSAIGYAGSKVIIVYKIDGQFVNQLLSLEGIADEFNRALETDGYDKIDACLNDFKTFKKKMIVEPQARSIRAEIMPEQIVIIVDWPIKISKKTATKTVSQQIEQKDVLLLIPLGRLWFVANDIVTNEVNGKNFIDEIERYIRAHPYLLRYSRIAPVNYPTYQQTIYMLNTIPYRAGEKPFYFYFAVDRR
ncbi:MAG: hypothetical protein QXP53_02675 [Candidatus Pacearchaeota archaeon]